MNTLNQAIYQMLRKQDKDLDGLKHLYTELKIIYYNKLWKR